ncbi:MAG: SIS domain-containing protein [Desulfobacterales bacterium]|nr:MAG: SIS domain-containing protein [Desulfobacterales bacterium]
MSIKTFIYGQPQVIETVLRTIPAALPQITPADSIYLVGSGTSLNALTAVQPLMTKLLKAQIRISGPLAFMTGTVKKPGSNCLAVILSQSGASTTTIAAVEHARRCGMRILTLTAEKESPICNVSDKILLIPVGTENVGPKTKGYTASVLCLLLLVLAMAGRKLQAPEFPNELARLIEQCDPVICDLAEACAQSDFIMVLGQERHLGTALEGSLKISEMSGVAAAAFDTEEAFHGRFHGLSSASLALFIAATFQQYDMALTGAEVLSDLGVAARILNLAGRPSSIHDLRLPWPRTDPLPELDLIHAIVPFQLLAWYLAKQKGRVPENMRYPNLSNKLQIKTSGVD